MPPVHCHRQLPVGDSAKVVAVLGARGQKERVKGGADRRCGMLQ